jgi:hypothetical protein
MKRSILVEGCDGSGKDTLIASLLETYPGHTLHDRASTSLGGPVANLAQWVEHDANRMHVTGPWIYNRHPLISEPIYAHYRAENPGFQSPEWASHEWIASYRRKVGNSSILVVCQPPMATVLTTLKHQGPDAHMPGVYENARALWTHYAMLTWPGKLIRYSYTTNTFKSLVDVLNHYMEY